MDGLGGIDRRTKLISIDTVIRHLGEHISIPVEVWVEDACRSTEVDRALEALGSVLE